MGDTTPPQMFFTSFDALSEDSLKHEQSNTLLVSAISCVTVRDFADMLEGRLCVCQEDAVLITLQLSEPGTAWALSGVSCSEKKTLSRERFGAPQLCRTTVPQHTAGQATCKILTLRRSAITRTTLKAEKVHRHQVQHGCPHSGSTAQGTTFVAEVPSGFVDAGHPVPTAAH